MREMGRFPYSDWVPHCMGGTAARYVSGQGPGRQHLMPTWLRSRRSHLEPIELTWKKLCRATQTALNPSPARVPRK